MKTARNIFIIVIVAVLLVFAILTPYNTLKTKQSNISNGLQVLNVQIDQRAKVLEKLINYLDPQLDIEKEIEEIIIDINEQMSSASTLTEKAEVNKEISSVVNGIINYSNQNIETMKKEFVDVLMEIRDAQVRVNAAKNDYNALVDSYTDDIQKFPMNIAAKFIETYNIEYFMTNEEIEEHNNK